MLRSFSMTVKGTFEGKLFRSWMFYFHIVKIHWISLNSLKASREGDASILRKNLSSIPWDKYVRWFLDLPNFVKAYQTSKTPSSCLGAGQYLRGNETINMEDSYLGMLHDDPFAQYNYYGSQVYVNVPAASPGPSSAHLYIRMSTRVSRVQVQVQVSRLHVIKLKAAKLRIQEQTRAEKGAKVQRNKRQSMVLISMWLTLVVNKYFAVIQCAHAWQIKNLAETNFVEILEGPNEFCQSSTSGPLLDVCRTSCRAAPGWKFGIMSSLKSYLFLSLKYVFELLNKFPHNRV